MDGEIPLHFILPLVFATGCVAGFINVMAGGGSLLTLPVLIFAGLDSTLANGTNRVAIAIQSLIGIQGFRSKRIKPQRYTYVLALAAFMGAIPGAFLAVEIPDIWFNRILAGVMVMVVIVTIINPGAGKTDGDEITSKPRRALTIFLFLIIGLYGGFIQAGTGLLIMSVLAGVHHFNLVKANVAKVLVVFVYTLIALSIFIWQGQVNWLLGFVLAAGNGTGAWFSSRLQVQKGDKWIRVFMIIAILGMAVNLILKTI